MKYTSNSPEETKKIGKEIAKSLEEKNILLLSGELGAGKTTLTKSILSHFGIDPHTVVSPTFTLMQVYACPQTAQDIHTVVHIDAYRMEREEELVEIGGTEYLGASVTLCIIEWPEHVKNISAKYQTQKIHISVDADNTRTITSTV
jgi:N-acetylmuramate 1-kinase